MADNSQVNLATTAGETFVTAEHAFSGDTAKSQGIFVGILSGSEGAWTYSLLVGGAGAVAAGVPRVTLASDDPAVVALQLIDNAVSGAGFNVSQLGGAAVPIGAGTEAAAVRVTIATDSTGVLSIDDNGGAITVDGTVAATQSGTWNVGTLTTITNVVHVDDNSSTLSIDDGGGVITVDGTVAATQSGTWSARMQDGSGNALTSKAPGSERALSVAIVDGSGNQVTSFGGTGGTSMTDDAAFTVGSGSITPVGGTYISGKDAVNDGDAGAFAMTAYRAVHTFLVDASGDAVSVGGGTQYDEDAAHSTGAKVTNAGVVRQDTAASLCGTDGDYTIPIVDSTGRLWVHVGALDAGTITTVSTVTNISQLGGQAVSMGTGARDAGTQRVTIATNDVVPASQSGTWNITNVSGTVSLPTGAATAAKQPALGTAGSPSSDVISIQGVASGTVVPVSDGGGALTVDGTVGISGSVAVTGTFWQATQPVSGTVTANAGTNLNTSALALETGGNLAGAATSLAVIDDWDDGSDRCRIVGAASEDAAAAGNPVLVAGRYDSTVRANETGDVATIATTPEGYVRAAVETVDYAFDGDTRCQVKRFRVKCGNGANTLISAVASKKFRLRSLAMLATSATAVTVYLHTTTDTGVLGDSTDKLTFDLDGVGGPAGVVLPYNPDGWLQTSTVNEALQATLSAAEEVWLIGTYIEVS